MQKERYRAWLEEQKYDSTTITAQMYRAERVEQYHGNLDEHYARDRMQGLLDELRYSSEDARRRRPNPTKIPFEGDIRNNLASYRNAAQRYRTFRDGSNGAADAPSAGATTVRDDAQQPEEDLGRQIGLERDMQAALRANIEQLEAGLTLADDGAERHVESGFIDITARDSSGATVVIELKAGPAGQRAVAQVLSYMGDVAAEEDGKAVRGILVASGFDGKAKSAAKMVPNLVLRKYSVKFTFADGHS